MLTNHPFLSRKQEGSALITVLVIVIVVTVLGITAMRMSLTGLRLATNSQAGNLLFQAADLGLQQFQFAVTGGVPTANVNIAMNSAGILGSTGDAAFCLSTRGAVWGSGAAQVVGFIDGRCTVGTPDQYVSGRNLVVTQVNTFRRPQTAYTSNVQVVNLATNLGGSAPPIEPDVVTITSTAIMPTLGSADLNVINNCLSIPESDDSGKLQSTDPVELAAAAAVVTITDCLTDSGAIFTTHQDMFLLGFPTR